jgi:hypothetical protein
VFFGAAERLGNHSKIRFGEQREQEQSKLGDGHGEGRLGSQVGEQ